MTYNFKLSSVLGTNYNNGNICFTKDGKNLLCPVGNNISLLFFDREESRTIPVESSYNICSLAVSPKDFIFVCVNEIGECSVMSLITGQIITTHKFRNKVSCLSFSPDGKFLAVLRDKALFIFKAPSLSKIYEPLEQISVRDIKFNITSIDWSSDSKYLIVGSVVFFGHQKDVISYSLAGNKYPIINSFFMKDSENCFTISSDSHLYYYEYNNPIKVEAKNSGIIDENGHSTKKQKVSKISYKPPRMEVYKDTEDNIIQHKITVCSYHKNEKKLATGFDNGMVYIHLMPDFIAQQLIEVGRTPVTSLVFNRTGSLISMGLKDQNQLKIYDWRAHTSIYDCQGHNRSFVSCLDYRGDGTQLVTGDAEGNMKIWSIVSGKCIGSYHDTNEAISVVKFPKLKLGIVFSADADGKVRGYDVNNHKNFCTLSVPTSESITTMSVDSLGNHVAVATNANSGLFDIYMWNISTRLMERLCGHISKVISVQFFEDSFMKSYLVSGSLDKTLKIWDFTVEDVQSIELQNDVLALSVRPDGLEVSVSLDNRTIVSFELMNHDQTREISNQYNFEMLKNEGDLVTGKRASYSKYINQLAYSSNGNLLIGAGVTKYVFIFDVSDTYNGFLLTTVTLTANLSQPGVAQVLDRKKARKPTDSKPDDNIHVTDVRFNPDGTSFAVACPEEGILIFSTEKSNIRPLGDQEYIDGGSNVDLNYLNKATTPKSVNMALKRGDWSEALIGALEIGETKLVNLVIRTIPFDSIAHVSKLHCANKTKIRLLKWCVNYLKFRYGKTKDRIDDGIIVYWMHQFVCNWNEFDFVRSTKPGTVRRIGDNNYNYQDIFANVFGVITDLYNSFDLGSSLFKSKYRLLKNLLEEIDSEDEVMDLDPKNEVESSDGDIEIMECS